MLAYILQTIAFQLIFLVAYELFLKKETFFAYNRAYLLITPVLALLLPLLKIPALQNVIPAETLVMLPEVFIGTNPPAGDPVKNALVASEEVQTINWWLLLYLGGFLFSLGFFFNKFRILKELFANKPVMRTANLKIVEVPGSKMACTFYNTIFLGAELSEKEREQIFSHELVHVKQKHTLDLLFFEVLRILFWFNPLIYIYQSRISALHEYLADAGVVKNVEKQDYFQQLLNSAFNTKDVSFINQFFNHSIIKKRIVMLQKNKSRSISKFKFLILLPLILAMLTYVSCSSTKSPAGAVSQEAPPPPPPPPSSATNVEVRQVHDLDDVNSPVPFAVVEQVPVFPGCGNLETNKERKDCMTDGVNELVSKNFNLALAKELGFTGIKRVYVRFKVSDEGVVTEVESRAPHPALGEEAERVVKMFPDMEPATHNGKKVAVLYSLPITLNVPEVETTEEGKN